MRQLKPKLFLETVVKHKALEDEFKSEQQKDNFEKMKEFAGAIGVNFSWELDSSGTIYARHIVTDHGWKISLDRGLDIFQYYDMNDAFAFGNSVRVRRLRRRLSNNKRKDLNMNKVQHYYPNGFQNAPMVQHWAINPRLSSSGNFI
jgi:hypothetical protein